ncbi:uncharacterized protein F54F2.2-like [Dendronephthya gigantea]|nr:uncharacterized protein F54F2.2-like [Dendronephthya gigantea]
MVKEMVGGCCVCSDERGWDENPLVYCDGHGCNVAVHQACYGIVQVPKGPWFCRKCESQERIARVKCELCPMKEGALKRTDTGGWAHVLCALYIPEVRFGNVSTMEPIILSSVPHEKFQKTCYLCEEHGRESKTSGGACMQCNKIGCRQAFHVTCAQAAKLLCEEQQGVSANTVKYVGYCSYHWNKKGKGVVIPRPNERARSKAEARSQIHKPDISKRPSVIGTTKPSESISPPIPTKPKNRKPSSKSSDTNIPEPLSATDNPLLPGSQHLMKTQKITSPLNTPSVRDQLLSNYPSVVSTHFPFQHTIPKPDTGVGLQAPRNGMPNPVLPQVSVPVTASSKEIWKSPSAPSTAKKTSKNEETANSTKTVSSAEAKASGKSSSSIQKKRKYNKAGSTEEDGKKKQKTTTSHEKKSSHSLGAVGKGKMPILPPSPFTPKSRSSESIREMEIPTKLEDFLEFQWKQGVEFLSHQTGYLDVASLLSCLHQLKHDNVKLETRLSELVKRRDHLLLVNSRLSKPSNLPATNSHSSTQDVKRSDIASPNVENGKNTTSSERTNQPSFGKSPSESFPPEVDMLTKTGQESQPKKQQDPKSQAQTKEQSTTKKEQPQRQRPHSEVQQPQTGKEISQQTLEKKSPVKGDTPPNVDERIREAASSPPRGSKTTTEGKASAVSLSNIAGERPSSRQSPKSRKSPQAGGSKNTKMKAQEQLMQQEHQKILQQQHQQLKQQQLNRQKFPQSHLLPVQQGNQHFPHQNSQLAFFKLPGYNGSEQHPMHQAKQGQVSMNGSPQQYNSQAIPRQFPNFVPYIEPGSMHNVRMQGYMPVYPVEKPLNKVMEEKIESSSGMEKSERRN